MARARRLVWVGSILLQKSHLVSPISAVTARRSPRQKMGGKRTTFARVEVFCSYPKPTFSDRP
jgi:hypothetical protein